MKKSYSKFRQELGKACLVGMVTVIFSTTAAYFLNNNGVPTGGFIAMTVLAIFFLFTARYCLAETEPKGTSKWQSLKVKKDTTIHVKVEESN